ncbi:hypothetical protein M1L60_41765 [Actinoplanes sp. TRM 88003]|uniref:Lipoprotein n=1 Tax=Paractinoplanes aksuensis TaxID=2939490 RepID=A0ABT1E1X3_9ACTN|nr:hypothetical protein [Actinoplanes aksuensis]MCO8277122.1 hypothetical protein [Actinoplanes aksuensis]
MPSVSRLTLAGLAVAGAVLLGTSGCGDLDEASAAPLTRENLITETADQLAAGSALTYSAKYQVAGGETATVSRAQRPGRAAYVYPGGRLITTTTVTIRCEGNSCTSATVDPAAAAGLDEAPLVSPEAAQAMLATAALDPAVETEQHDTTITGRHATCLKVLSSPARTFDVCVTNEGILASFTATIDGQRIDQALTSYSETVPPDAFLVPTGAELIDKSAK